MKLNYFVISVISLCIILSGCESNPSSQSGKLTVTKPDKITSLQPDEKFVAAKRFLHSWNAGAVALSALKEKIASERSQGGVGMAELIRRATADLQEEDIENLAAGIYAAHLSQNCLVELARFTESSTGNRFFKSVVSNVTAKSQDKSSMTDVMKQFSADELTEILKFSQSDAFQQLQAALPSINQELGDAGRKLGEQKMKEYLKKH